MVNSRERLLDAATRVLLAHGADHLTLAAVATEAGVSKGGLFYHFATKQALAEGLIDRLVGQFDTALGAAGDHPGAATRAYLDNTVSTRHTRAGTEADRAATALLAGLIVDPESLTPLRAAYTRWQHRLEHDGIDPAVATAVRLAVDGWWMARLLDLAPPGKTLHSQTRALLTSLIDGRHG
ncbi:TetR/AcrR family transcriptional regulator [Kibdelosporangium phytohabitans]|uniref:TetR family transcriptional regulator n=1 Tax=Kibdelosporangium phytohabitans TaxID=860235 RepID=A0A0N9I2F5_9PSEU|nr:TetR/AcrR family transcriptional regulator [Kibdelosporangium phytohabitans]ALG10049.1 TetR family transcriptional regulator [Kibdelosporangium phytohabitans]MBE1461018.1 AcrR family transcriptional regulator [Kibdelosporangium phytohabitans]